MADTTYTPIQRKFYQVARLLVEIRLLAEKQGAAFRAENRLSVARAYEGIASKLQDNSGVGSLDSIVSILENESSAWYKPELLVTDEDILVSMTNLLRYVNSHRPQALARITEEYVLGNERSKSLLSEFRSRVSHLRLQDEELCDFHSLSQQLGRLQIGQTLDDQ